MTEEHKFDTTQLEDLLSNDSFVLWVVNPNSETDHYWNSWIQLNPDRREHVQRAVQIVKSTRYLKEYAMGDEVYKKIFINIVNHHNQRKTNLSGSIDFPIRLLKYAAIIVMAFGLAFFIYNQKSEGIIASSIPTMETKSTDFGQKRTLMLPDGTMVKLNAGSSIKYLSEFNDSIRSVTLNGEAFFDVVRDESRPFIIKSGQIMTKVLGTSFNIRAYLNESHSTVSVLSGQVEVSSPEDKVIITPHYEARFNRQLESISIQSFDRRSVLGWREGILFFSNEPLEDTFLKIERWFDVEFIFQAGKGMEGTYSGSYKNSTLKEVLDGVTLASDLEYKIMEQNKIIISMKQ